MRYKITLFFLLITGAIYAQNCPIPTYQSKGGKGQEHLLDLSAIYHLGGGFYSGFSMGGYQYKGMAFGMVPGMHKMDTPVEHKSYHLKKTDCSEYKLYYPYDLDVNLDTNVYVAYNGHSHDYRRKDFEFMISVMDIDLLFERDTLVLMKLDIPAYGRYHEELIQALENEFNFRYGSPVDSLMNVPTDDPNYATSLRKWRYSFCKKDIILSIQQLYDKRENTFDEMIVRFTLARFQK